MGLMGSIFGTITAIFFIGLIGFLIYRFCVYRRQKESQAIARPVAPTNPNSYPSGAPYPTGQPTYFVTPGGESQPPYPTTNVTPQPGSAWVAPVSGWAGQASPPPPYPGS